MKKKIKRYPRQQYVMGIVPIRMHAMLAPAASPVVSVLYPARSLCYLYYIYIRTYAHTHAHAYAGGCQARGSPRGGSACSGTIRPRRRHTHTQRAHSAADGTTGGTAAHLRRLINRAESVPVYNVVLKTRYRRCKSVSPCVNPYLVHDFNIIA